MANKLEYEIVIPMKIEGTKKAKKEFAEMEKQFAKFARRSQSSSARILRGAGQKSGTMGRAATNILTKSMVDFMPHRSLARLGSDVGRSAGKRIWGGQMAADYASKYQENLLNQGKSVVTSKALKGVNIAAGKGMGAAGAKGAAIGGAMGGALGGALMLLPALIGLIAASSKMLQKTLGNILKYILLLIRPIGDMIAVLFYPLMMIIRPLSMMVNTIIRPFLMEARKSFRLSLMLGREAKKARGLGMIETAGQLDIASKDMMGTGLQALGLGFGKLIANMSGELVKMLGGLFIDTLGFQFQLLANIIDGMTGGMLGLSEGMETFLATSTAGAKAFVESGVDTALEAINSTIDGMLEDIKEKNQAFSDFGSDTKKLLNSIAQHGQNIPDFDTKLANLWSKLRKNGVKAVNNINTKMKELLTNSEALNNKGKDENGQSIIPKDIKDYFKPGVFGDNDLSKWFNLDGVTRAQEDLKKSTENVTSENGIFIGIIKGISEFLGGIFNPNLDGTNAFIKTMAENTSDFASRLLNNAIPTINALKDTMIAVIKGVDSALTACNNAVLKAQAAAASAARSAAESVRPPTKTSLATGGSIPETGLYYLHRGETVVNPVSSSFNNTSGSSSGSLPSIEFNNCTFGGTEDWKKEMDKYFNKQMRHIR